MNSASVNRVQVKEGDYRVSGDPNVVLSTFLGSCVAVCMRDPEIRLGGMNHFLLPGDDDFLDPRHAERFGVHLMEVLINGLMSHGASRDRIEAKLFGGAQILSHGRDIGQANANFARKFLRVEGIRIVASSLGGDRGRRVEFRPCSGQARQRRLPLNTLPGVSPKAEMPDLLESGTLEWL